MEEGVSPMSDALADPVSTDAVARFRHATTDNDIPARPHDVIPTYRADTLESILRISARLFENAPTGRQGGWWWLGIELI